MDTRTPLLLAAAGQDASAPAAEPASTTTMLLLATVLLLVCLGLFLLEFMIPSFGLISVMALAAAGGSIWAAFQFDAISGSELMPTGWTFVVLNIALIPVIIVVGFKLLWRSPLVVTTVIDSTDTSPERAAELAQLRGKQGQALTPLRPAGSARIEDTTLSVQTRGAFISAGTIVEVVAIEGNRIYVKEVRA